MPNYVKNILSFDGDQDQVSRLFSTIQGENGPVDFDKLIPMPSELEIDVYKRQNKYRRILRNSATHQKRKPPAAARGFQCVRG